jgi:hypothetical protein
MDLEVLRNIGGCIFATFLIQLIRWVYFTLGGE